jgi:hypothetical protein
MALIDSMLGSVSNSGRKTLVAPLAIQHHLAHFSEHMQLFIDAIVEGYKGASTSNIDNSELLRAALTNHILESYYPEIQKLAPLVSSPTNLGAILESHDPMWEVEKGEDFPFFKTVHFPQLRDLHTSMRSILENVDITNGLRYIPSYYAPKLYAHMETEMKSRHSFQKSNKRIKKLGELLGSEITDAELAHINQAMSRVFGEVKKLADAHAVTNLWELIVLADRAVSDTDQPMFCGTDVHMRLMHSALSVLPTDVAVSVPLSYVNNPDLVDEDNGISRSDDVADIENGVAPMIGDIFEHMLLIAGRTARGISIRLNDITLPVNLHPISVTLTSIFKEGMRELLPDIQSEFLGRWLELAAKGSKTPVKYDDFKVKMDNALHVDRNAIPRAFDDHLFKMVGSLPEELVRKYVEKRSVYTSMIEAPIDRTLIRITDTVDELRSTARVRLESDQPFTYYGDKVIRKEGSTNEAFILRSKIDSNIAVDGEMAEGVAKIVAELYKLRQPDVQSMDKEFSYAEFIRNLRHDQGDKVRRTRDITANGDTELRLSNVLRGGEFQYKDDFVLFREHAHNNEMSMPRTMIRLHQQSIIHDYPNGSVAYGTISGMLASDLFSRWAGTITALATRVARVYSAAPFAEVAKELTVVTQYQSTSYLKRSTGFDTFYSPMDVMTDDSVWRFLSAMQTQKLARDKIDIEVLEKLKRHELFVNSSLLIDIENYASSVAKSVINNFNVESEGFQTFAKFVAGTATDADMGKMRDPRVLTVFNSLVTVTFDALEKKDTIITLILTKALMNEITSKVKK